VIAFGVLTIARGGIPGGERALPSCCDPGVAHTTPNAELTTK
jgi:hypothetical protein